jgi:hypothetical protein
MINLTKTYNNFTAVSLLYEQILRVQFHVVINIVKLCETTDRKHMVNVQVLRFILF